MTDRDPLTWGYSPGLERLQQIQNNYPPLDHIGAPAGKDFKAGKETAEDVEKTLKPEEE